MSRHARRVDINQPVIVEALRKAGALVQHLHSVGGGCPDLLIGIAGRLVLLELKDGKGKLTEHEARFFRDWKGYPVHLVTSPAEAIAVVSQYRAQETQEKPTT